MRTTRVIVACLGIAVAAQGLSSPTSASTPKTVATAAPAAALAPVAAIQADSLVESYGVGVHMGFSNTPYTNVDGVAAALKDLGVRHVRDDLFLSRPDQYAAMRRVSEQAGVKFNLIMGRPDRPGTPTDYVQTLKTSLGSGVVESIEGVNEWDLFGPQGATNPWVVQMMTWQAQLYAAAKAEPTTAGLPILGPSLAFRQNYALAGDMSAFSDLANAHMYPGGYRPANQVPQVTAALRASIPTKPLVVTEAGYHNATAHTGGHKGVPEAVAATYAPRLLLEHVKRGHQRVYTYELLDEFVDPGLTNAEANFGLLRNDLSPKPAFTAVKNLIALVNDPGPAFTPTALGIAADGMPSDARYLLTQKRDGRYVLLLWRDVDVFNPATQQPVAVTPATVNVRLDTAKSLSVYRPSQGATPVTSTVGASVPVSLDGNVVAITIDAPPPPPPPVGPAPTGVKTAKGSKSATLTWTLPTTTATVTGFEVTRTPGNASWTLSAATRSFKNTGLTSRTKYTYKIRTLSTGGPSAWVTAPVVTPS